MGNLVEVETQGSVARLIVNRPDRLNAINRQVLTELDASLSGLTQGSDIRCLVVSGAGEKAFVAGADIAEMESLSPAEAEAFSEFGNRVFSRLEGLPFPVIAEVQGYALGGGCELALACDFVYASERAVFGQPEVKLGLTPGFGGTQRLVRRVGLAYAKELIFSGRNIHATEALRIGLANAVFPASELEKAVLQVASEIAAAAPRAVTAAKRVMPFALEGPLQAGVAQEVAAFVECFRTEDRKEGTDAFLRKRNAQFRGC